VQPDRIIVSIDRIQIADFNATQSLIIFILPIVLLALGARVDFDVIPIPIESSPLVQIAASAHTNSDFLSKANEYLYRSIRLDCKISECLLWVVSCPTAARDLADRSALDSSRSD
jgi:hypothetical protein